jgi:hypothetical protein
LVRYQELSGPEANITFRQELTHIGHFHFCEFARATGQAKKRYHGVD